MNIAELNRRLDNIVRFGVIEQTDFVTDPIQPRVRVRTGDILTTWIPISTNRAGTDSEHDPVQKGEEVILLSPSGELAQAVVVGKLFSDNHPSPSASPTTFFREFRDGSSLSYDTAAHKLHALNGPSSITMDREEITLQIGESIIKMTAADILIDAGRVDINP